MQQTLKEFENAIATCEDIFVKKLKDYGTSWRLMRLSSITDQIFIKAQRIRSIEIKGNQKINESVISEFIGMVNYSIIALIQMQMQNSSEIDISIEKAIELYKKISNESKELMVKKNHDYDEAWRMMRVSSYTDMILTKLHRIKNIEDNLGETIASEGVESNYQDIINYSIFAIIKLKK